MAAWLFSVDVYLFAYYFAALPRGFQVYGVCCLVSEALLICVLIKLTRDLHPMRHLLPFIEKKVTEKWGKRFADSFASAEAMVGGIESVRMAMLPSRALGEIETALDSLQLFDRGVIR